jgi:rhodanese-related sulfurtransferase
VPDTVDTDTLRQKIERGDEFVLADANSPMSYAASHLPGAINIPPGTESDRAPRRIPDLDTPVITYCMNPRCESSVDVARQLIALGYRNVFHYPGGKEEWIDAGLPLEGGRA